MLTSSSSCESGAPVLDLCIPLPRVVEPVDADVIVLASVELTSGDGTDEAESHTVDRMVFTSLTIPSWLRKCNSNLQMCTSFKKKKKSCQQTKPHVNQKLHSTMKKLKMSQTKYYSSIINSGYYLKAVRRRLTMAMERVDSKRDCLGAA